MASNICQLTFDCNNTVRKFHKGPIAGLYVVVRLSLSGRKPLAVLRCIAVGLWGYGFVLTIEGASKPIHRRTR